MKIACFRESSAPESTLFKNIINFSVDLFSFLNPPAVVPPTFSHFSPTHPFFFYLSTVLPSLLFSRSSFLPSLEKIHVFAESVSFLLAGRPALVNRLYSHIRIHCVSSATFYLVRYRPSTSFIVTFSFIIFTCHWIS